VSSGRSNSTEQWKSFVVVLLLRSAIQIKEIEGLTLREFGKPLKDQAMIERNPDLGCMMAT
jgi:hypothetical protein